MQLANSWKQSGRVSLWRYTENELNFPGWHLNADAAGCRLLLSLFGALAADGTGSRTVATTAPMKAQLSVPNNKIGRAAWVAPEKLRIAVSPIAEEWSFPTHLDPAVFTVGSAWLSQLRDGIAGIPERRGDHSIGNRKSSLPLWFWW